MQTGDNNVTVHELWDIGERSWNRNKVHNLFGDYLCDKICDILIVSDGPNDRIIWFHATSGAFTTKVGYSWLIL